MDSLSITLLVIISTSFIGAFLKGRNKDRCLAKFDDFFVHIYKGKEKTIWGRIDVVSNAVLVYFEKQDGKSNKNFILYKHEFKSMELILRLHAHFDETQKLRRDKLLKRTLKPGLTSIIKRKFGVVMSTAKDAVLEVINALMSSMKSVGPMKGMGDQTKHLDKLKDDSVATMTNNSYEPIWERNIGEAVVVEAIDDENFEFKGTLVEYSQNYILLFDATIGGMDVAENHDLLISRDVATIRHIVKSK
jgi:hypothetical protein